MVGTISIQMFTGKSLLLFLHITTQDNRDRKEKGSNEKREQKLQCYKTYTLTSSHNRAMKSTPRCYDNLDIMFQLKAKSFRLSIVWPCCAEHLRKKLHI